MKKHSTLILFAFCLLNTMSIQAQDIIVNADNDTIYCKILDVSNENIRYQIQDVNRRITNTLNRRYILSYQIHDEVIRDEVSDLDERVTENKKDLAFRFAIGGGYAKKQGNIIKTGDPKLDRASRDLANGYNLEGDIEYYFNWKPTDVFHYGIALHFNYINHTATATNVYIDWYGGLADRYQESQNVFYVAPAFVMRYDLQNWLFTVSVGLGPIFFTNPMKANYVQITGNTITVGTHSCLGVDYKISPDWGIGLRLSSVSGVYNSLNIVGGKIELDQPMSASSWMISGILSFRTK